MDPIHFKHYYDYNYIKSLPDGKGSSIFIPQHKKPRTKPKKKKRR